MSQEVTWVTVSDRRRGSVAQQACGALGADWEGQTPSGEKSSVLGDGLELGLHLFELGELVGGRIGGRAGHVLLAVLEHDTARLIRAVGGRAEAAGGDAVLLEHVLGEGGLNIAEVVAVAVKDLGRGQQVELGDIELARGRLEFDVDAER